MKPSVPKIARFAANVAVMLFFGMGFLFRCANPIAPQGGPIDSLPPRLIDIRPAFGTTDFDAKRIYVEFDEYLQFKDQQKEFYTSPQMKTKPLITLKGRGIQIDLKDTLYENTTYSLNFGSSIADNNEGNILHGFRYVFSTGKEIDSLLMSGYTVDGNTKDSIGKTFLFFYDTTIDSITRSFTPEYDSTLLLLPPQVVARAQGNGIFVAENLKPVPYRIYAFQDTNGNQAYDPGIDPVAFLDSLCNPSAMPSFDLWYDTLRRYVIAEPQLYFRLFKDETFKRQRLASSTRPLQHEAILYFGAEKPDIERITFEGIDSTDVITEYLSRGRDTIAYWFHVPSEQLPDTIKGEIVYFRHDSINQLERATQQLNLVWKFVDTRSRRERREGAKTQTKTREEQVQAEAQEEEKEEGKEDVKEENPFRYRMDAPPMLNPEKNISFDFDYPLTKVDTSQIQLIRRDGERMFRVRSSLERDTMRLRKWTLSAPWTAGQAYELMIPAGTFTDVAGQQNDTIQTKFTIMTPEKYATFIIRVKGKTPESEYIIQVLKGNQMVKELRHVRTGEYTLEYLEPGTVRIRIVEDGNGNGEWDRGNLIARIQPERVEIFSDKGTDELVTKEGWTNDFEIDMEKLFAPLTMENVVREWQQKEAIRHQKILEYLEEARKRKREQPRQQQGTPYQGAGMQDVRGLIKR